MNGEIHTCGERAPIPVSARGKHLVVDIHCHLGIPAADGIVQAKYPGPPPGIHDFTNAKTAEVNKAQFAQIGRTLNTIDTRLEDMDRLGIDVQALSPSPGQYFYFTDAETGREAAQAVNNGMAEAVAKHPDRFVGMGTVPLQDPRLAVEEMRRCVKELDLRGIEINTNVNGKDFHAEEFRPFWAAAEELGILIFMHPLGFTDAKRMTEYYFNNLIGNPLESTLALGHLIFGGVLDAYPGLKICVAHGGGYIPGYWGTNGPRLARARRLLRTLQARALQLPAQALVRHSGVRQGRTRKPRQDAWRRPFVPWLGLSLRHVGAGSGRLP